MNPLYVQAADTQVPILKALGKRLRAQANPITLVYSPNGSCSNIAYLYQNKFTSNAMGGGTFYIPADPSFDPKSTPPTCTPPSDASPDLAISIVFPSAENCPSVPAKPAGIGVLSGPVQAFVFAAPISSSQIAITAEEAYLVFGLGADGMVAPWTDPQFIFGRPATKGTQISIGASIGVPAGKWQLLNDPMHRIDQSSMMASTLASHNADGNAEKTIGILGTEIYDQASNRANLKALAFRSFKQQRAYWPDSTPTAFDKANVRDGHYTLWSYVQYLMQVDESGTPKSAAVKMLVDLLRGHEATLNPTFESLDDVVANGLVPACAMKVQRSTEGGDLSLFRADEPCGCYFDTKVSGGAPTCTACSAASPCTSGVCRHGYCEVK